MENILICCTKIYIMCFECFEETLMVCISHDNLQFSDPKNKI